MISKENVSIMISKVSISKGRDRKRLKQRTKMETQLLRHYQRDSPSKSSSDRRRRNITDRPEDSVLLSGKKNAEQGQNSHQNIIVRYDNVANRRHHKASNLRYIFDKLSSQS